MFCRQPCSTIAISLQALFAKNLLQDR
ncbi:hypothetical protein LZ24_01880 [Desulfobotulus alkaliphilus]|uniref:Uncharacterized protein n=1 Tax=Desulfobotulus alkaliphilus TaxID=622671 RepID=A0A562RTG6_9BACT|nr:hypothetical protein LZ24_01880 [Desulfobotulus alkaliphilus]